MTDRALNARLRQKSRRAGLAIGLSMLATIALCVGGATMIYAALMPVLSDVIPIPNAARPAAPVSEAPPVTTDVEPQSAAASTDGGPNQAQPADQAVQAAQPTAEPEPTPTPAPEPTETPFEATHQVNALQAVNLRSGPNGQILRAVPIAAPLQYLDETEVGSDGQDWMRFETEDGEEGWLRADLVSPFEP